MAVIEDITSQIKTAVYGKDVRSNIADGIEAINSAQEDLESTFTQLVINAGSSNAEIVTARGNYNELDDRLNATDSSLAEKAKQSDLDATNAQIATKVGKDEITNGLTPKGNIAYASLPTTSNSNGDYYYCSDGDGTHGAGNYVWNGTAWYFGGTGNEGFNIVSSSIDSISSSTNTGDRIFPNIVTGGRYDPYTGAYVTDSTYYAISITAVPGERYRFTARFGGGNYASIMPINSSGEVIGHLGSELALADQNNYEVVVPTNVVELRCSFSINTGSYYPYIFKYGYKTYASYDKQLRTIKAYNAGNTIHSIDFTIGTYDFTNNVINYRGAGRQRVVSRAGFTLYKPLTLKCTDWTTYVCRYAKVGDAAVSYATKGTMLTIGDYLFVEFYTITSAYISDYSFVYSVFSLVDTSIVDNTTMIANNLKMLASGATWTDVSANYATNTGYPTIANNVVTGYGSETYWQHKEVTPDYGLMASFRIMPNAGTRAYMYYVDSSGKILKEEVKGNAAAYTEVRHPIIAPTGCTKVIIMSSTITALRIEKVSVNALQTALPTYYTDTWINNILSQIKEKTKFVNGISFIFATDLHFHDNAQNSKYLLKNILDGTTVPFIVCGGDFPYAYGTADDVTWAGDSLVSYQNFVGANRFFTIRGNHDFTVKTSASDSSGYTAPYANAYNYLCRNQEKWITHLQPQNLCYYIENEAQKTRIVCLNSSDGQSSDTSATWGVGYKISQDQVDWILNDALSKDGYRYIFVSHIPADSTLTGYDSSQDVIHEIAKALKNHTSLNYSNGTITAIKDFTSSTSIMITHITGHCHKDLSNVDNNLLSITTTCDACYADDGEGGVLGTLTEQAFDVFCINYDTGAIDTVRVGRGSNREWTY